MNRALRIAARLCLAAALALAAFAWWGLETASGRHSFDEMAGMIPFGAGVLAAVLMLCAGVAAWFSRRAA
jgi:cytosine/uracil/thiamine/allantoin permease